MNYLKNKRKYKIFLKENRCDSGYDLLLVIEIKLTELLQNLKLTGIAAERLQEALELCREAQCTHDAKTIANLFMIMQVYFPQWNKEIK